MWRLPGAVCTPRQKALLLLSTRSYAAGMRVRAKVSAYSGMYGWCMRCTLGRRSIHELRISHPRHSGGMRWRS